MITYALNVRMGDLYSLVSRVSKFAAKAESLGPIHGVHFFVRGDELWAEATDRYRMLCRRVRFELGEQHANYDACEFLLSLDSVKRLLQVVKKPKSKSIARSVYAKLTVTEDAVLVEDPYSGMSATLPVMMAEFPNVRRLLDVRVEDCIDETVTMSGALLASLDPSKDLGIDGVTLWSTEKKMWVFAADEDEVGLIMPKRFEGGKQESPQALMNLLAGKTQPQATA